MSDTNKRPDISIPGSGLLQQAVRAKGANKSLLQEAANMKAKKPSMAPTVDTGVTTGSNPNTITKLTPAESSSSLARTRAKVRAKVEAAKAAQELAKKRRTQ